MADPFFTPQALAAIGALGGAALKPNNPLQGALLGGIAGYSGGTALGLGAPTAATTGATTAAGGASDSLLANQIAGNRAASYAGGNIAASNAANTANFNALNASGLSFGGRSPIDPTMLNVTNAAPSFAEKIGMAGKNAYENTGQSLTALGATNSLLQSDQPQIASAPAMPIQAGRQLKPSETLAYLDPYRQSVIGSPQISLLG